MTRKELFWAILILVMLVIIVIVSGIFYFNHVVGDIGTGHVTFQVEDDLENEEEQNKKIEVIEGDLIFEEIES